MRSLNTTLKNIRRTPYQALSATFVLTVTFFVTAIFAMVALGAQITLRHFETRPQVIAYLKDDTTQPDIQPLTTQLRQSQVVDSINFVSQDQALQIYKESVGNDPLLLGTVTDLSVITADILPASLEVSVSDPQNFTQVIDILSASSLVETNSQGEKDIDFPQNVVTQLTAWTKAIRSAGIILIAALAFSSVLTIMIIVSLKIGHRRFEIKTLKLLGAENKFITAPYLFESCFYSLVGSLFGWLFAYIALLYSTPFLAPRLAGIISLPPSPLLMFQVLAGLLLFALLLGIISGSLAVARFLRK